MNPAPPTGTAPAPAGPPCVRHPLIESAWYCKTCGAPLCRECVHVFDSREGAFASCKTCEERCDPILTKAPAESRPGAAESPQERLARHRRDHIAPRVLIAVAAALQLVIAWGAYNPLAAMVTLPIWAAIAAGAFMFVLYKLEVEVEDLRTLAWKAAAIGLAVHAARLTAITVIGLDVPGSGPEAIAMLLPLAICFVLIPLALIGGLVAWLFDLDASETTFAILFLYLADAMVFAVLKMGGMPA